MHEHASVTLDNIADFNDEDLLCSLLRAPDYIVVACQVAAAFFRMLPDASRTFRAGTRTSGPQSVTCPSGQGALLTHPF